MERKLRNATARLRNLKDFLSSTRNLNQQEQGSSSHTNSTNQYQPSTFENHRKSSKGSTGSQPMSVSLFDLVEPCSRQGSTSFMSAPDGTFHSNNSVSMYGLSSTEVSQGQRPGELSTTIMTSRPGPLPSKNPAIRLFYTIRSKFRKRRDRGSKNIDSADFGPFISVKNTGRVTSGTNSHYLEGAHSVDNLPCAGASGYAEDDSFSTPLGCRDRNYGNENSSGRITSANSCFVITTQDNTSCQHSVSPGDAINQITDQTSTCGLSLRSTPNASNLPSPMASSSLGITVPHASTISSPTTPSSRSPRSPSEPNRLKGLAKELFDLIHYGWYWGGLSKEEAEEKLRNEPDGAFIVRDSSSSVHILSLSFNSKGKTKHTRIDYVDGKFCFLTSETEAFSSVAELVEHWIRNSEQGIYCYSKSTRANGPTSYPVRLTKPISRFTEVKSLQFLSSFVLYQYTRLDLIPKLPLPPQLIEFIGQQHYF